MNLNDKSMEPKEEIFNEAALLSAIYKTWGEFGAHSEVFRILTEQRDGYKDQLTEMKRLFDSSQEEVKRFKDAFVRSGNLYLSLNWEEPIPVDQAMRKRILELESRVKELTEQNTFLDANCQIHAGNLARLLKLEESQKGLIKMFYNDLGMIAGHPGISEEIKRDMKKAQEFVLETALDLGFNPEEII